jgi:hypothetical protein
LEGKVVDRKLLVQIKLLSNGNFRKKKIKEKVEIYLKIFLKKNQIKTAKQRKLLVINCAVRKLKKFNLGKNICLLFIMSVVAA